MFIVNCGRLEIEFNRKSQIQNRKLKGPVSFWTKRPAVGFDLARVLVGGLFVSDLPKNFLGDLANDIAVEGARDTFHQLVGNTRRDLHDEFFRDPRLLYHGCGRFGFDEPVRGPDAGFLDKRRKIQRIAFIDADRCSRFNSRRR